MVVWFNRRQRPYTCCYTLTTRMTPALWWVVMAANLCLINCEGQRHKTSVHRPWLLKREESWSETELRPSCLPTKHLIVWTNWLKICSLSVVLHNTVISDVCLVLAGQAVITLTPSDTANSAPAINMMLITDNILSLDPFLFWVQRWSIFVDLTFEILRHSKIVKTTFVKC